MEKIRRSTADGICISAISLSELEYGVAKSAYPKKNADELKRFLTIFNVLSFDSLASEKYGQIRTYLEKRGLPIGPMDMLIAAHALSQNLTLITNNTREFTRVDGLLLEDWSQ